MRINQAVLKLLHYRAGVSVTFMTEVCESPDLTVVPTVSSTDTKSCSVGTLLTLHFYLCQQGG